MPIIVFKAACWIERLEGHDEATKALTLVVVGLMAIMMIPKFDYAGFVLNARTNAYFESSHVHAGLYL